MTELLYQVDSYVREFDAVVTVVDGSSVCLDRTAFYPGGGGRMNPVFCCGFLQARNRPGQGREEEGSREMRRDVTASPRSIVCSEIGGS